MGFFKRTMYDIEQDLRRAIARNVGDSPGIKLFYSIQRGLTGYPDEWLQEKTNAIKTGNFPQEQNKFLTEALDMVMEQWRKSADPWERAKKRPKEKPAPTIQEQYDAALAVFNRIDYIGQRLALAQKSYANSRNLERLGIERYINSIRDEMRRYRDYDKELGEAKALVTKLYNQLHGINPNSTSTWTLPNPYANWGKARIQSEIVTLEIQAAPLRNALLDIEKSILAGNDDWSNYEKKTNLSTALGELDYKLSLLRKVT